MNANQAYQTKLAEVNALIEKLQLQMQLNVNEQSKDSANYGFAGDLGYVQEQLQNAVNFLAGTED